MKVIKSLLLSIFIISVFCVISYGQQLRCDCEAPLDLTTDMKQYTTWINQGTNVNWQIWIDTFNESLASWTYAAAAVISFTDVEYRSYKNTGHYYQWPVGSDQYRTGVWSNYQGRQVIVYCAATMGNDNGGNARSYAKVWW